MDYLDGLNEAQRAAVVNTEGPSMVIAGAGSGKTRVLTYRIAHLLNKGVDPFSILSLTFTNKAAKEMKERIGSIIGDADSKYIMMGTFHSVFSRILRAESELIGYPKNFTIYDTQDSRSLLRDIIKAMKLDDKIYKPATVQGRISSAKNNLISPEAYAQNSEIMTDDKATGRPRIAEIYKNYAIRCFKAGAMDFDDLLFKTNVLFRDHKDVLLKYQHRFKYLLVDEYQDTNYSQYLIVKKLAALNENLCVVGDDAQSIYAFRGANIENILNFKRDYPDYNLFKLEQNYRSTKIIVNAANSVIEKNKSQIQKNVWTDNSEGEKIKVVKAVTDNEEGKIIAQTIYETKMNNQLANSDFSILYRTNAQSRSMEEALRKLNIPYKIYGGLSFYQRKEIKDLISYFRLAANPNDEESLKRVINYPARGIGKTTMDKIVLAANLNDVTMWDIISDSDRYDVGLNAGTKNKVNEFVTMMNSFSTSLDKKDAFELASHIAQQTGVLRDLYQDKTPEGLSRYENIQELLNGLKEFTESNNEDEVKYLTDFLVDVALLTDADNEKEEDKDKVSLMTIHASKGLEFPYVFIVGMEENLFPSQMSLTSRADLEEERRLFYVAITRAEKKAYLSYATQRYKWGSLVYCEPSRFLEEIHQDFVDFPSSKSINKPSFSSTGGLKKRVQKSAEGRKLTKVSSTSSAIMSSDVKGDDLSKLQIGMEVNHHRFGKGKVLKIEDGKATIFFPTSGQKQLLLKFAKLTIL